MNLEVESNDSEDYSDNDSDGELQEAFAKGLLKPGLNTVTEKPVKTFANKVGDMKRIAKDIKLKLPWIERLDLTNKQAPLAPEIAVQMKEQEDKRSNELKNNAKLPRVDPSADPVLNDFKREMMFYRQAQAAVLEAIPRLKSMGIATKRPENYFAEMAKSDDHMAKVREALLKRKTVQERSEHVKQLRAQRREGKALQIQAKLQRQQDKREMLNQVKKVRKGLSSNLEFLNNKGKGKPAEGSRKSLEKRKTHDKKYGFGGKKRGSKMNTKESAADISEYRRPGRPKFGKTRNMQRGGKGGKIGKGGKVANKRPGKNRRQKMKSKK